jgi:hypothetical protein
MCSWLSGSVSSLTEILVLRYGYEHFAKDVTRHSEPSLELCFCETLPLPTVTAYLIIANKIIFFDTCQPVVEMPFSVRSSFREGCAALAGVRRIGQPRRNKSEQRYDFIIIG